MVFSLFSRVALAAVLIWSGVTLGAPPVTISGAVIGASIVPLMVRSLRKRRTLPAEVAGTLEASFEARLQDLEERQYAELNYVEERTDSRLGDTMRRLAELEDRLEFAERTIATLTDTDPGRDPNRLQVMTPI